MSQGGVEEIYRAPVSQQFNEEYDDKQYVSVKNRKDLCACCDPEVVSCDMWCFGCLCPFILIGSSDEMKKSQFTKTNGFCSGSGNKVCCAMFWGNVVGDVVFGIGPLVGAGFGASCSNLHKRSGCCEYIADYFQYLFCVPCRACADYSSALAQVEMNKQVINEMNKIFDPRRSERGPSNGTRHRKNDDPKA